MSEKKFAEPLCPFCGAELDISQIGKGEWSPRKCRCGAIYTCEDTTDESDLVKLAELLGLNWLMAEPDQAEFGFVLDVGELALDQRWYEPGPFDKPMPFHLVAVRRKFDATNAN